MNEMETAELFNKELDKLLQGGSAPRFESDQGAMDLAAALAGADFSEESKVRESLRASLVPAGTGFLEDLRGLLSGNYVRAAFAAAVLLVALLPLARRHGGHAPVAPAPVVATLPELPAPLPASAGQASRLHSGLASVVPAEGLFASVPMGRLEPQRIKDFPIASAGPGAPIALAEGREVKLQNGSGIVLETEGAVFTLERREIKPEDIFQVRTL